MNTLEVFTKFHIGVTNVVYKHLLCVKRRVTISIMGCTVNTSMGYVELSVGSLVYLAVSTPLRV